MEEMENYQGVTQVEALKLSQVSLFPLGDGYLIPQLIYYMNMTGH